MREIKFRAWDRVLKKMLYQKQVEQFDDMVGFRFDHFEDENPIYMQFTGPKDKNGKEIYEGDIVWWGKDDHAPACSVLFRNGRFMIYNSVDDEYLPLFDVVDGAEIIGNIYHNPDLLKGEQV